MASFEVPKTRDMLCHLPHAFSATHQVAFRNFSLRQLSHTGAQAATNLTFCPHALVLPSPDRILKSQVFLPTLSLLRYNHPSNAYKRHSWSWWQAIVSMRNLGWSHGKRWQSWSQSTTSHSPSSPCVRSICWEGLEVKTIFLLGSWIHFSCTKGSMALKQVHWVKEPKERRLTKIVTLPSINSTKTCRTCSCVFVVLKFVLHVPSAFCTKTHKTRRFILTHIIPLMSQSSWTITSSALAHQMKVSSWTGSKQIKQARSGGEKIKKPDWITLNGTSFPVERS